MFLHPQINLPKFCLLLYSVCIIVFRFIEKAEPINRNFDLIRSSWFIKKQTRVIVYFVKCIYIFLSSHIQYNFCEYFSFYFSGDWIQFWLQTRLQVPEAWRSPSEVWEQISCLMARRSGTRQLLWQVSSLF